MPSRRGSLFALMGKAEDKTLAGYEVLLCVTGGIACYKSADLASLLVRSGAGATVAMTEAAGRFVTPLTFQTLTARRVYTSLWQAADAYRPQHLSLSEAADLMVIAPATADIIARLTGGLADDLVSALGLSAHGQCPILIAPAMNSSMWRAPATCDNVERLKSRGVHVVGPAEGRLASGATGPGRMAEAVDILQATKKILLAKPPKSQK